jgi:hypothetical protein
MVMKKGPLYISIITIVLIVSLFLVLPDKMVIKSTGTLAFENHIALAAQANGTFSNGEPLPQQIEPLLSRGGLPIVSITYADPANENEDALTVIFDGIPDLHIPKSEFSLKAGENTTAEVEARLNTAIQKSLEIQTPLSSLAEDDPARNGVLLDNESIERVQRTDNVTAQGTEIERVQVTDNLVTALGYGAIHIYSLTPLEFITQFNGLDAGPVTGEWWQ